MAGEFTGKYGAFKHVKKSLDSLKASSKKNLGVKSSKKKASLAGAIDALESDDDDMDDAEKAAAPETIEEEAAEDDSEAAAMAAKMKALEAELAEKVEDGGAMAAKMAALETELAEKMRAMEEELAEKILDLEEKLAAAEALVPPPVTKKDSDCQAESDEAFDHRMAMNTIRGQMSVLTARLMDLGKETEITEEQVEAEKRRLEEEKAKDDSGGTAAISNALKMTEEWNEEDIEKPDEGLMGELKSAVGIKDYKPIADALRVRCETLVTKGRAARHRIVALENELATAINDKEAMDQWARVCHRRATGAEEARVGTMEELKDIKMRTRAIRLGENTEYESQNVDVVAAAVQIETMQDAVMEKEEYLTLTRLQLEDVTRERDLLKAEAEALARRKEIRAKWDELLSPKAVLDRAKMTPVRDFDSDETPEETPAAANDAPGAGADDEAAAETPPREEDAAKLDVSGSEAAAAIEAVDLEDPEKDETPGEEKEGEDAASGSGSGGEKSDEEDSDGAKKKKKRQADFSILEFLGIVSAAEETEETSETTTTTTTTETTTTETKMATESTSEVVVEEKVQEISTPEEADEKPKKKASLAGAIDKLSSSDDDEDDEDDGGDAAPGRTTKISANADATESHAVTTTTSSEYESTHVTTDVRHEEEEETITTTVTKTITTTVIINSDGEEEEIVEEHVDEQVVTSDGTAVDKTSATVNTTLSDDETTGGTSFWARMNQKAGDVDSDSE